MSQQFKILNAINEGACIIDFQGNIIFWNQSLASWSGIQASDIVHKNIYQSFERFNQEHVKTRILSLQQNRSPIVFSAQLHHYFIPCCLSDGSYRSQQTTLTLVDDDKHILITIQDFTNHLHMLKKQHKINQHLQDELHKHQVLAEHHSQLVAAMDQAAEAIIIINRTGLIKYINQTFSKETQYTSAEVLQLRSYQSLHPDQEEGFEAQVIDTMKTGKAWQGRQQVQRKDGSIFTANTSIAPIITDACPQAQYAVVIQEDISQQLALEEQYRHIQKREALTTLVGGIAHDFNNLLAGILGHIYLAGREVKEIPKTAERLKKIEKSAYEAADIVKQLISFSHQEQIDKNNLPLDSFLKEFSKVIERTVPDNMTFSLDYAQAKYPLHGSADQLQHSFLNIVQNSIDACKDCDNPKIQMSLKRFNAIDYPEVAMRHPKLQHGDYAYISIKDNGMGIHPSHHDRIFDPFFTTKQIGSGLGLASVMGTIRYHKGVIEVESTLNEGTCTHIYLPLEIKKERQDNSQDDKAMLKKASILLVDDDALVRETAAELLDSLGHHITTARDGQEAVEIFLAQPESFNLIIMDMIMPRLGGPAAAHKIRQSNPTIPIIFATAYDQSVSIHDAKKFENSTLISKPFRPDDFQRLITSFL